METLRCVDTCPQPLSQLNSSFCCSSPCKIATTALSALVLLTGILVFSKVIHLQSMGTTVPGWACIGSGLTFIAVATCVHYIKKQTKVDSTSPVAATPAPTPNPEEGFSALPSDENNVPSHSELSSEIRYKSILEIAQALVAQHLGTPNPNEATQKEHALAIRKSLRSIEESEIRDENLVYFSEQYFTQGRILAACTCIRGLHDTNKRNAHYIEFAQRLFDQHQKNLAKQEMQHVYPQQIITCLRSIGDATTKNAQLSVFGQQYVSKQMIQAAHICFLAMRSDSEKLPEWMQ